MYINSEVYTALKGLIGWKQPYDPDYDIVSADNIASSSGLDYQDFSALATVPNLHQTQNYEGISDDNFNTFLEDLEKASINKILNSLFSDNDIIENKVLFPFEFDWGNTLPNDTSFVGYEIDLYKRNDLAFIVNSVFTAFNGIETFNLYLLHSSVNAALQTKELTTVENSDVKTALNWQLPSMKYAGGKYYIGYLRSGLTALAVNRDYSTANLANCYNIARIRPIKVDSWDADTMFDVNDIEYTDEYYGLNFDFSGVKDYTNFIIQNKEKFINAIGLQTAQSVLDTIASTSRSDLVERNIMGAAKLELEGNYDNENIPKFPGINRRLAKEIKSLRENLIDYPIMEKGTLS